MKKIFFLFFSLFLLSGKANAEVWTIPDDFETILEGLEAAQSGDTILLKPGVYNEVVEVTKDGLTLEGSSNQECVIDPPGGAILALYAIKISSATGVQLKNLKIIHSKKALIVDHSQNVLIENCWIGDGGGNEACGMEIGNTTGITIIGNTIKNLKGDNSVDAFGIVITNVQDFRIQGNLIEGIIGGQGVDGYYSYSPYTPIIIDPPLIFWARTLYSGGGARGISVEINSDEFKSQDTRNYIVNNLLNNIYGGSHVSVGGSADVTYEGKSGIDSEAIRVVNLENVEISNNTIYGIKGPYAVSSGGNGGGVFVAGSEDISIRNNILMDIQKGSDITVLGRYPMMIRNNPYVFGVINGTAECDGNNYWDVPNLLKSDDIYNATITFGIHELNKNPKFQNPSEGNFQLSGDSPCIDAGVLIENVTSDFLGINRPLQTKSEPGGDGSCYDIGAFEFIPMEISVNAKPVEGISPLTVSLVGSATANMGWIRSYHWLFDVGVNSEINYVTEVSVTSGAQYTYDQPGIYEVQFWADTNLNETSFALQVISVWTLTPTPSTSATPTPTITSTPTPTETVSPTPTENTVVNVDLSGDRKVDVEDLLLFLNLFHSQNPEKVDFNHDSEVNALDLFELSKYWGVTY